VPVGVCSIAIVSAGTRNERVSVSVDERSTCPSMDVSRLSADEMSCRRFEVSCPSIGEGMPVLAFKIVLSEVRERCVRCCHLERRRRQ
jgi:hypothetical protein